MDEGDLVEHALSGREGLVRHVHDGLAWVAWSDNAVNTANTVTPTADLVRRRTALEMAAVDEPDAGPMASPAQEGGADAAL
ncbi:hypothetical protein [Methylobacterium indicum]|uniref:hypothetical protein n=1 Tax=Methylobacterium indicum TaxID=1775910 RepID=UPI0010420555|nr:hypothetical protein [Methylobacterium indicum]